MITQCCHLGYPDTLIFKSSEVYVLNLFLRENNMFNLLFHLTKIKARFLISFSLKKRQIKAGCEVMKFCRLNLWNKKHFTTLC